MSLHGRIPTSLVGIKRLAKQIASEKSVQHTAALEEAAKLAGYQTFLHAKRALTDQGKRPGTASSPVASAKQTKMTYSDFHMGTRSRWMAGVNAISPSGDNITSWTGRADIARIMSPFMGSNANHAHLPTGGGFDFRGVSLGREAGCLDFHVDGRLYITVKPQRLNLVRFEADPAESFLLLELAHLEPTGAYDEEYSRRLAERGDEEVIDLGGARYVRRDGSDDGVYFDEHGTERDLPDNHRQVMRFLGGSIMLVTKGSIWNGLSATYDGRHSRMSVEQLQDLVQNLITRRSAA